MVNEVGAGGVAVVGGSSETGTATGVATGDATGTCPLSTGTGVTSWTDGVGSIVAVALEDVAVGAGVVGGAPAKQTWAWELQ